MRTGVCLIGVLVVVAVGGMMVRGQPDRPPTPSGVRTITLTGTGTVTSKPDSARVTFGVVSRAAAVPDGRAKTAAAVRKVLDSVAALKLADVRTYTDQTWVQTARDEEGRPAKASGYDVGQRFTARIRRDDPQALAREVERIYDAGLANGANADGGVEFFLADELPLVRQAQQRAVEDALASAAAYAAGAKVTVAEVLSIDATPAQYTARGQGGEIITAEAGDTSSRTFEAGIVSVSRTVRVVVRY